MESDVKTKWQNVKPNQKNQYVMYTKRNKWDPKTKKEENETKNHNSHVAMHSLTFEMLFYFIWMCNQLQSILIPLRDGENESTQKAWDQNTKDDQFGYSGTVNGHEKDYQIHIWKRI